MRALMCFIFNVAVLLMMIRMWLVARVDIITRSGNGNNSMMTVLVLRQGWHCEVLTASPRHNQNNNTAAAS